MGIVIGKIKALKLALKVQNKEVLGNLYQNIATISISLVHIQKWYDDNSSFEEFLQLESNAYGKLDRLLHQ